MEKRTEEQEELRKRALRALEYAQRLEPVSEVRQLTPELRLWHYPAFYPWASWPVMRTDVRVDPVRLRVREVTWDMPADMRRLTDPMEGLRRGFHTRPTLTVRDAALPVEEYRALLTAGSGVRIPAVTPEHGFGLDGETFGIEIGDSFAEMRLQWWCAGPPEWGELAEWAATLRAFLQRCVEAASH